MRAPGRGAGLALAALGGAAALACAAPAEVRYERELARAPAGSRHAIYDERLQELMRRLDRLARERLPQALDVDQVEERRVRDLGEVAGALADAAGALPEVGKGLELEPDEQAAFAELAAELAGQAAELAALPPGTAPAEVRARLDAMQGVCVQCHTRFRLPGLEGLEGSPDGGSEGRTPGGPDGS